MLHESSYFAEHSITCMILQHDKQSWYLQKYLTLKSAKFLEIHLEMEWVDL